MLRIFIHSCFDTAFPIGKTSLTFIAREAPARELVVSRLAALTAEVRLPAAVAPEERQPVAQATASPAWVEGEEVLAVSEVETLAEDTLVADTLVADTLVADTLVADTLVADTLVADTTAGDNRVDSSRDPNTMDRSNHNGSRLIRRRIRHLSSRIRTAVETAT
ncbi:MAG: hypothetical protein L0Z73_06300 [Gammaproteobacteria bacterium]|nr:hypothetical protein [Gammaproteobacteria bacterium]